MYQCEDIDLGKVGKLWHCSSWIPICKLLTLVLNCSVSNLEYKISLGKIFLCPLHLMLSVHMKKALSLNDQVDLLPKVARKCIMVFSEHRSINITFSLERTSADIPLFFLLCDDAMAAPLEARSVWGRFTEIVKLLSF